jgi:hypothetical protein
MAGIQSRKGGPSREAWHFAARRGPYSAITTLAAAPARTSPRARHTRRRPGKRRARQTVAAREDSRACRQPLTSTPGSESLCAARIVCRPPRLSDARFSRRPDLRGDEKVIPEGMGYPLDTAQRCMTVGAVGLRSAGRFAPPITIGLELREKRGGSPYCCSVSLRKKLRGASIRPAREEKRQE